MSTGMAWYTTRTRKTHVVRRSIDVILQRMVTNHVRVVNLLQWRHQFVAITPRQAKVTHKDGPQVYKDEETNKHKLVDGENVDAEVVGHRLKVTIYRVKSVGCKGGGD